MENLKRRDKINYYLDIAETVLERSTCLRRKFGAIIVKNDSIVSTGYVGAPRGRANCVDLGVCTREKLNVPKGQRYELCRSVHAEANAIIAASREEMLGATLYLAGHDAKTGELDGNVEPCSMCKRLIINAGISTVIIRNSRDTYTTINVESWVDRDESINGTDGY
ncbi:MAG: deaminase [Ruminococcus sp.]|nr:deaminase [Ruminococcus sp.]MCM1480271.1 deaminase [Muribaculaceae bacterium]